MIIRFPAKAQGPRSRRPELDLDNPPGQLVNPIPESLLYKPVHGGYAGSLPADTEEMFTPTEPTMSIHSRVRRLLKK
jgi:hypothetical protein